MKNILLLSILFAAGMFSANVFAQNSDEPVLQRVMQVYSNGSVSQSIVVSSIDSIKFVLEDVPHVSDFRDSTYILNNSVFFTMKAVAGGTFTMGCTGEQGNDCNSDESPSHSVTLSSYFIGETEVTQALWEVVMGKSLSEIIAENGGNSYGKGDNYPMYYVSWHDIVGTSSSSVGYTVNGINYYQNGFCYKLSQLVGGGKQFRLPTEAEWEYAARGGSAAESQTKYSGSNTIDNVAWYYDNAYSTREVKGKQSNALGLYDMSGNVFEWWSDWYGYYSSESQTSPTGATTGSDRVLRGGSWINFARDCRVSFRFNDGPGNRDYNYGFRLACSSN